jgi:hypothetical protein
MAASAYLGELQIVRMQFHCELHGRALVRREQPPSSRWHYLTNSFKLSRPSTRRRWQEKSRTRRGRAPVFTELDVTTQATRSTTISRSARNQSMARGLPGKSKRACAPCSVQVTNLLRNSASITKGHGQHGQT